MTSIDHVLIVGTGAMASLFAARICSAGISVRMLGSWREAVETIARDNLRHIDNYGQSRTCTVQISSDPKAFTGTKLALVLVKSWQTGNAAERLEECLDADGLALTLQNGLGNFEILAEILGNERVAVGTTTAGATLIQAGVVQAAGEGRIWLGPHPGRAKLSKILLHAGFEVESIQDIDSLIWGKLVINAAINPLTAILQMRNGGLLDLEPARELMNLVAVESARIASHMGIQLPYPDPAAAAQAVAEDTAGNRSSMLQDMTRGAPTEIEAICGQIVKHGSALGIPTPFNQALLNLVKSLIAGNQRSAFKMNEIDFAPAAS